MPEPISRAVGSEAEEELPVVRRGRNIIAVIGIDKYKHDPWWELENARSDAAGIRDYFVNELDFEELTNPLYDEDATKAAIEILVKDELPLLLEEDDSLVFFFAGHGHTVTVRVGEEEILTGYLIPVEGQPPEERRHSTFIELDELLRDLALVPARHLLVILDACHSGFAMGRAVDKWRDGGVPEYTDPLSRRVSRKVITSAMDDQRALDAGPRPGHSLFTGALIESLHTGEADSKRKGFVTSSELGNHVRFSVAEWAKSKNKNQTPVFGTFYLDNQGELLIPLKGEAYNKTQAQECLEVGDCIYELGWIAGDDKRFRSAVRQYREALKFANLAKLALPEAELGLGKALLTSENLDKAAKVLAELLCREGDEAPVDTGLYLGIAYAKREVFRDAACTLKEWREQHPEHPDSAWVGEYVDWLSASTGPDGGRRLALLIGINTYQLRRAYTLNGCRNSVEKLMKPALIRHGGFDEADIEVLTDDDATREAIMAAFDWLSTQSKSADSVFVYYTGHAVPASIPGASGKNNDVENVYLILHDTSDGPGYLTNGITADELHTLMQQIQAGRKTLVLDTHASERFLELARREGNYALILASDTGELAYEWKVEVDGEELFCGLLTGALYQSLQNADADTLTYDEWFTGALRIVQEESADTRLFRQRQTPYFDGIGHQRVFGRDDTYLSAFEFSLRRIWPELTIGELTKLYTAFSGRVKAAHPRAHGGFGRAFAAKGHYSQALRALQSAEPWQGQDPAIASAMIRARLVTGQHHEALAGAQRYVDQALAADRSVPDGLLDSLRALAGSRKHALLVGIDEYQSDSIPSLQGALNDVTALREVLTRRWGFGADEIVELVNGEATRERILQQFERLSELAGEEPAVFYFAGRGSHDRDHLPTLVSYDARQDDVYDISLEELAALAQQATHLVAVLDTSFGGASPDASERALSADPRQAAGPQRFTGHDLWVKHVESLRIGAVSLLQSAMTR